MRISWINDSIHAPVSVLYDRTSVKTLTEIWNGSCGRAWNNMRMHENELISEYMNVDVPRRVHTHTHTWHITYHWLRSFNTSWHTCSVCIKYTAIETLSIERKWKDVGICVRAHQTFNSDTSCGCIVHNKHMTDWFVHDYGERISTEKCKAIAINHIGNMKYRMSRSMHNKKTRH